MQIKIDLYSDTSTMPTQAMREFMCAAEVGDEQKGEDPSVNRLQDMVAELTGKESALFLPSGTMCNQIAFAVHCGPGDLGLPLGEVGQVSQNLACLFDLPDGDFE